MNCLLLGTGGVPSENDVADDIAMKYEFIEQQLGTIEAT